MFEIPIINYYDNNSKIQFGIDLVNTNLDVDLNRADNLNWISYKLFLTIGEDEKYSIGEQLCLNGLKTFINGMIDIVSDMKNRKPGDYETRTFEYYSLEPAFGIKMSNAIDDLFSFEIWLQMLVVTEGSVSYEKGYRFTVQVDEIYDFAVKLQHQLDALLESV